MSGSVEMNSLPLEGHSLLLIRPESIIMAHPYASLHESGALKVLHSPLIGLIQTIDLCLNSLDHLNQEPIVSTLTHLKHRLQSMNNVTEVQNFPSQVDNRDALSSGRTAI
jgi:hypothetical protein